MLSSLSSLKGAVFSAPRHSETIVFFLHYRATFLLLVSCSILVTSRQLVGDKIHCSTMPGGEISPELLQDYCWASSTFSVNSAYLKEAGVVAPHPGIVGSEDPSEYTYRNYYQFVHLVLLLLGLLFYVPHLLWKSAEGRRMDRYYDAVDACQPPSGKDEGDEAEKDYLRPAAVYVKDRWGQQGCLARAYVLCEVLALANLLLQILLLDLFLQGEFLGLGLLYVAHYRADTSDPITTFPLVTSCYFKRFGSGGVVEVMDALCVLPINALNVKIFLFLWVWFAALLLLTLADLAVLIVACLFACCRTALARLKRQRADDGAFASLVESGDCGDWFVLSCLSRHMDSLDFSRLADSISDLDCKEP